ncbi:SNF2 family N-terminal domain-containing protein [Phanerochaete sordida]|uniref:DNA helicase n=1 Tax=Phanerochaete sordida TaxID=48140 RepID=A0A9P3GGT2_9APHY|nr:SNF2 family N-terminal domain-containing protein [Phanerochaete sordida]
MTSATRRHPSRNSHDHPEASVTARGTSSGTGPAEWTDQLLQEERQRLINEKQSEAARVLDTHDNLVRERFHLQKFVLLTSYDPEEAKTDNSDVFQQFKMKYDLLGSNDAGPSRKTRRARNERMQALQTPSASAPPGLSNKPATDDKVVWKLLDQVKSKGKGKQRALEETVLHSISATPTRGRKGKARAVAPPDDDSMSISSSNIPHTSVSAYSRRRSAMEPPPAPPPTYKKRKLRTSEAVNVDPSSPRAQSPAQRSTRASSRVEKSLAESIVDLPPEPTSPTVKRIKLIVGPREPTLTHPLQRPPAKKYASVTDFLMSYSAPTGKDLDSAALRALYRDDLAVWRKIDGLRRQGRMLYRPPDDDGAGERWPETHRKPDAWDAVIDAVQARAEVQLPKGPEVAAQVASQVKVYWGLRAVRDDKARVQEEKRLKALAKATIRMVTSEWKKAVFHIREQERLRREAEERRRGHEHLDAILDQSGQLLEAQQVDMTKGDLSRSRSRSSSLADTLSRWASASPAPEEDLGSDVDGNDDDERGQEQDSDSDDETVEAHDTGSLISRSKSFSEVDEGTDPPLSPSPTFHDGDDGDEGFHSIPSEPNATRPQSPAFDVPIGSLDALAGTGGAVQSPGKGRPVSSEKSPVRQHVKPLSESNGRMSVKSLLIDQDSGLSSGRSSPFPPQDQVPQLPPQAEEIPQRTANGYQRPPVEEPQAVPDQLRVDVEPLDLKNSVIPDHDAADGTATATPVDDEQDLVEEEVGTQSSIPNYLRPYAVAPLEWDPEEKIKPPLLLRGNLRPYQHSGLEWLASLHTNNVNGILADEMGLGKTIQTIALLAHLACDRGIWGPHLIIVPTSVLLNWEMEFKKFLPGFKVLSYHGNTKRRKELRQGWNNKYHFNVCVTSYTLASRDSHVFKRKAWYYMILDEAHMIKNFKSQRWNILLMFRSFRRLLLTGTPLQNNLTELWALLQFLMSGTNFANLKEFADWFANPLEKAIEMGTVLDDEVQERVGKLHSVLRPYLLRRLKRDVEKELPSKFEHLVMCPLSKRQRFLYDEFMSRADTRHDLQSGVYQKIANILMQLRKVVNHPDLFEVRPIRTSFAMSRSAIADYEIKELLVRRQLLQEDDAAKVNLDFLGLRFIDRQNTSQLAQEERQRLDGTRCLPLITELPERPPEDTRTISGYKRYTRYLEKVNTAARWAQMRYINWKRCNSNELIFSEETLSIVQRCYKPLLPYSALDKRIGHLTNCDRVNLLVKSYAARSEEMADVVDRFAFVTPSVVARDLPNIALSGQEEPVSRYAFDTEFDAALHRATVKLQIAFPDPSLLQYDCGKLQELARLLRERKAGGHRVLIFTQMTRILDILEIFLNLHGYLYLRLDGATKIEDRQYITERFNTDPRIFCFISSSRSGGVGINLTGADTVIFYDSDFNPQMDRQCEDRAHRIGQIRDVHIYRLIARHTVEEALLRKANQKRSLDDLVIQKGEFDWRVLFGDDGAGSGLGVGTVGGAGGLSVAALERALGDVEDSEDRVAREVAAREEVEITGADEADFGDSAAGVRRVRIETEEQEPDADEDRGGDAQDADGAEDDEDEEEDGGTTVDYMLGFVQADMEFFGEWRI